MMCPTTIMQHQAEIDRRQQQAEIDRFNDLLAEANDRLLRAKKEADTNCLRYKKEVQDLEQQILETNEPLVKKMRAKVKYLEEEMGAIEYLLYPVFHKDDSKEKALNNKKQRLMDAEEAYENNMALVQQKQKKIQIIEKELEEAEIDYERLIQWKSYAGH